MPPLRVLHINAVDAEGGSARAAYALHTELRKLGVRSRMLVRYKTTNDRDVYEISRFPLRIADKLIGRGLDHLGLHYLFYPSTYALLFRWLLREADVVQVYNTHGGYWSHTALPILSRIKPVVWRFDDMWPVTGDCIYSYDCKRWLEGCGRCSDLYQTSSPRLKTDTTALLWEIKRLSYKSSHFHITAPSKWMADVARQSPLTRGKPVEVIHYGIDTNTFRPIEKRSARQRLGLGMDGMTLGFGAANALDPRKGGVFFREAVGILRRKRGPVNVILFGLNSENFELNEGDRVARFGRLREDSLLALIYSAMDVFLMPSLAEQFGLTALESMACGTPVVAFEVDGVKEHVQHMRTGYLAARKDAADLAYGVECIIGTEDRYKGMAANCRRLVQNEYSQQLQAKRYLELYMAIAR